MVVYAPNKEKLININWFWFLTTIFFLILGAISAPTMYDFCCFSRDDTTFGANAKTFREIMPLSYPNLSAH